MIIVAYEPEDDLKINFTLPIKPVHYTKITQKDRDLQRKDLYELPEFEIITPGILQLTSR